MNITEFPLNFLKMMLIQLSVSCTKAGLLRPAEEQIPGGTSAGTELELHRKAILDAGQNLPSLN